MATAAVNIININRTPFEVVNGGVKLTKSGNIKRTPNNGSSNQWVDPIRDKDDIKKIYSYFDINLTNAVTKSKKHKYSRDKALFVLGITLGFRVNDLLDLKWDDVFENDMKTFKNSFSRHKEQKTKKLKTVYITDQIKKELKNYIEYASIIPEKGEYIFVSADKNRNRISDANVELTIKTIAKECGLTGNYNTHSLRKTCAYQMYMYLKDNNDNLALPKVQKFLNHRNQNDTLRYLGLEQSMEAETVDMMYAGLF